MGLGLGPGLKAKIIGIEESFIGLIRITNTKGRIWIDYFRSKKCLKNVCHV